MKKRMLSMLLALIMVLGLIPCQRLRGGQNRLPVF